MQPATYIPIIFLFIVVFIILKRRKSVVAKKIVEKRSKGEKTEMIELSKKFAPLVLLFYPDRNMDLGTPEEVLTDEALEKAYGVPASQLRNTERLTRSQMIEANRVEKEMEEKLKEALDK